MGPEFFLLLTSHILSRLYVQLEEIHSIIRHQADKARKTCLPSLYCICSPNVLCDLWPDSKFTDRSKVDNMNIMKCTYIA